VDEIAAPFWAFTAVIVAADIFHLNNNEPAKD